MLLPEVEIRKLTALFTQEALQASLDVSEVDAGEPMAVVLVPDADGQQRQRVLDAMTGSRVIVGPSRQWWTVKSSYLRALRTWALAAHGPGVVDTEDHLVDLVLSADHDAIADLRRRVLAPLAGLRPSTAERLAETLRAWVLHLGRRDAVADSLFVHPQTVRYRMTQLRDFYGDRLDDPAAVLEITVALGLTGARPPLVATPPASIR